MSRGRVDLFEAHPDFAKRIEMALDPESLREYLHPYGLSARTGKAFISDAGDGSSIGSAGIECDLVAAHEAAARFGMPEVMKLNIEGSEYDVLDDLDKYGLIPETTLYLIQFHRNVPGYLERYETCISALGRSHQQVVTAPFVWEAWQRA